MKLSCRLLSAAVALLFTTQSLRAATDAPTPAEAVAGRNLVKRYADTIVSVEMVVLVKAGGARGGQSREVKREVNGTVISPSGLTVTSLSLIDPSAAAGGGRGGADVPETEFKEVKLRLADNSEVLARVVLKDADLDLAFIVPESEAAAGRQFPFVKLDEAAEAAVLGSYAEITRVPKTLQRVPIVQMSTIVGIIEKPRRYFLVSQQSFGCPVFDLQGRVLGISLVYSSGGRQVGAVVLPAADVAEMAKQAAAVKLEPVEKIITDVVKPAEEPKAP